MTDLILPDRRLESPGLYYPGRAPIGSLQVDFTNPLVKGLRHLYMPLISRGVLKNGSLDMLGNVVTMSDPYVEGLRPTLIDGSVAYVPVGTFFSAQYVDRIYSTTDITIANDITVMQDCYIGDLTADLALVGFAGASPWSWLDTLGGVLRISAYTQYDTTNVISSIGRHLVGLIWRANNTYQTIYNGQYSQSGTSTRQTFTGTCGPQGKQAWGSSLNGDNPLYVPYWWAVWNRALSEAETMQMKINPYQILTKS